MADVTEITPNFVSRTTTDETTNETVEQPKKKTTKEKAKELRESISLPPPPGDSVRLPAFQQWVKLLTPEMQANNRINVYVYRTYPAIIAQKVDPNATKYIDFISENFETITEQYFIERFGGGKYKLVIADQEKGRNNFGGYFQVTIDIPITMYDPKIDYRTLNLQDKNNKGFIPWAVAKGKINENGEVMSPTGTQQQQQLDAVGMLKVVTDFMSNMSKEQQAALKRSMGEGDNTKGVTEILLERMKQDDPNKQITALTSVITAMNSMKSNDGGGIAAMIPLFIQMMQQQAEASRQQFQMMIELMKSNKSESNEEGEGRSKISELKELLEVAKEIKSGSSHNEKEKSTTVEIIEALSPILVPMLNTAAAFMEMRTVSTTPNNPTTPTVVNSPNSTTPVSQNRQDLILAAAQQATTTQQQAQQAQSNNPTVMSDTNKEATIIIQQFGPLIINHLAREGWEFASLVADMYGDPVANKVAKLGYENLLQAGKSVPEFWQQALNLYDEEYITNWLKSFCNYKEELKKLSEEED